MILLALVCLIAAIIIVLFAGSFLVEPCICLFLIVSVCLWSILFRFSCVLCLNE